MNDLTFSIVPTYKGPAEPVTPVPNPDEVATLIVGDRRWDDWTSVKVMHKYADPFAEFTFSNTERPVTVQFKPWDECRIYLADKLAVAGVITVRQVAYDANTHGVQLMGKGRTWFAARASIIDENGDYDGKSFEEVAREIIKPFGVGIKIIGELDGTPFAKLQVEPGEKCWDCLERLARPRGIVMGSDHLGNFLLIGKHPAPVEDTLREGYNIKSMKCIISVEHVHSDYLVRGQPPGQQEGAPEQQQGEAPGTAKHYSPILTTAEQPVWSQEEMQERARNEAVWSEGKIIEAVIGVQGWKRPSGDLWRVGETVMVISPMAPLNQAMTIQSATFSQDSETGTTTTLECVMPWLLRGEASVNVGVPDVAQDPRSYEGVATPAEPATSVPEPPPVDLPIAI
jgi:prophage tail gpP-like protein